MPKTAPDPALCLSQVLRAERGRILAALLARVGDFQLAEDALQEASASALIHWARSGVPTHPLAWMIRVSFRKAIDRLRRSTREGRDSAALAILAHDEAAEEAEMIADERLRLIFTCCHPALEVKSQIALTLRSICGLTTGEVAKAFLDHEATMGQRLSRAKAKIAAAGVPFRVPDPDEWPERLHAVLGTLYLIFNAGHGEPGAARDLCGEAIFLARLLDELAPGEPEIEGALALMLLIHARAGARIGADGVSVPPSTQDRSLWDEGMIGEAMTMLRRAMARGRIGPYQLKAAIALCHVVPQQPDWPQILDLYDALLILEPTDVVRLNRAVALGEVRGPEAALAEVTVLQGNLAHYQPFHALHADLLGRTGQPTAARNAYERAIALAQSKADALLLASRRNAL